MEVALIGIGGVLVGLLAGHFLTIEREKRRRRLAQLDMSRNEALDTLRDVSEVALEAIHAFRFPHSHPSSANPAICERVVEDFMKPAQLLFVRVESIRDWTEDDTSNSHALITAVIDYKKVHDQGKENSPDDRNIILSLVGAMRRRIDVLRTAD